MLLLGRVFLYHVVKLADAIQYGKNMEKSALHGLRPKEEDMIRRTIASLGMVVFLGAIMAVGCQKSKENQPASPASSEPSSAGVDTPVSDQAAAQSATAMAPESPASTQEEAAPTGSGTVESAQPAGGFVPAAENTPPEAKSSEAANQEDDNRVNLGRMLGGAARAAASAVPVPQGGKPASQGPAFQGEAPPFGGGNTQPNP